MKYKLIDKHTGETLEIYNGIEELLEHISSVRAGYILDSWIPTGLYNQVEGLFDKLKADDTNKYDLIITDQTVHLFNDILSIIREEEGKLKTALDSATDFVAELHGICETYTYKGKSSMDEDTERYFELEDAINIFYLTNKEVLLDD